MKTTTQPVHFLWEDNGYTQSPTDSTPKTPGYDAQFTTAEATNNGQRIYLPHSRTAVDIKEGVFDGSWAVQFDLSDPWWLRACFGAPSTSGSGPTYDHVYDGTPDPLRWVIGYPDTTTERVLTGCVAARASVQPTVGEAVAQVVLEGFYASEESNSPGSLTTQPTPDYDVLNYVDARLDLDGTEQTIMQDASLELVLNTAAIRGWTSRFPIDYSVANFEPALDYSKLRDASDAARENVYGGSSSMQEDIPTDPVTLDFDNGETGSSTNQVTFSATGTFPESYGESGIGDVTQLTTEELNRMIGDVSVTATNGTSSAP